MMLEVHRLEAGYGPFQVISDVSLVVRPGEMVALLGPNGAGKTTLLKALMGLTWRRGKIVFQGKSIEHLPPHRIAHLGIAIVLEGRSLFPEMTVYENLLVGAYRPMARQRFKERLSEVYTLFPILKNREKQLAGTLSGGEQQMLAIARALMSAPKLLLVDEPTLGLAPRLGTELLRLLSNLKAEVPILLAEQNVALTLELADRVYVLEEGRVVLEGPAKDMLQDTRVRESYLGIR
ncbi:ABC transporter ATP-binding protein [Thermus antranikianii]|nr:ABC transporter ATP-binding protein [Thermus antranikianii]QWK23240.1 MAG: ABC transporter ATP-binding protein [Thermus antranikianii]